MELTSLVQKCLKSNEKCKICVPARVTEQFIQADRYIAVIEKQDDYAIFLYSSKTIPCFRSDDLSLEDVVKVDKSFRTVQENSFNKQRPVNSLDTLDVFDPLFVKEMETPGTDSKGAVILGLRSSDKHIQLELPNDSSTKRFIGELKQAQDARRVSSADGKSNRHSVNWVVRRRAFSFKSRPKSTSSISSVTSQNAAFGLPSSFAWVQQHLDKINKHRSDNPFANDVFDPLSYMNIQNPTGDIVSAENMEDIPTEPRFPEMDRLKKAESRDSLDQFDENNFRNDFTDSLGKITHQLGIGGSGAELVNNLKPTTARESIVRYFMNEREDEFTYKKNLRVFCGTWNVNGQHPPISVAKWLQRDDVPPDVYAIGFQELDLSNQAYLFADSAKETEWQNVVRRSLHPKAKYRKVRLIRLVGIMLIIYVKETIAGSVHFVDADYVPTGIMGIMGNKGGVGVRLSINNTSILFINSHLAAHQDEFERRNQDYRDIAAKMKFRQFVPPLTIDEHDMVFWIGDLNYRISGLEIDVVKSMIEHEKFTDLQSYDQLHQQLGRSPDVFPGYMEGKVLFRPTYKYNPGTDEWDSSEKNRIPAWCDRILFKGPGINLLQYREHSELLISDHKPVSASFEVQVKVVDEEKSKRVYEDIMKKLDRLENDYLPQVKLDKTEFTFTDVRFIEPMEHTLTVSNTGQVPVEFEFIEKLDEKSYCKPWMTLSPFKSVIAPGDKCEVQLEMYVDKSSVAHLNSGMDQIDDILVLHLAGGKDFFITVNGNFIASSFGCSVEALVQMHGPIREIPVAQLVEIEQPGSLLKRDMTQGGRLYAVPKEVWRLVDHIWQYGQKESSLFQQPGLHKEILAIRDCLDTGVPDRIPGSVHSVAEALLLFLESLPDPVIPCSVYHRCLDCSNNFMLCKQVLSQIPECHKNVFVYVCAFLRELLTHAEENNLEVKFLASIFGEVLLRPSKQPSPPSAMGSDHSSARAIAKEEEMKRAAFIYHFLTNDFYE